MGGRVLRNCVKRGVWDQKWVWHASQPPHLQKVIYIPEQVVAKYFNETPMCLGLDLVSCQEGLGTRLVLIMHVIIHNIVVNV